MKAMVIQSKEIISTAEERCQEAEVRSCMNSSFIEDFVWIGQCGCLRLHTINSFHRHKGNLCASSIKFVLIIALKF